MPMSFDQQGRRIVQVEILLSEFRGRIYANPVRVRKNTATPADKLLDQLWMSPPNVINEQVGQNAKASTHSLPSDRSRRGEQKTIAATAHPNLHSHWEQSL